MRKRFKNLCWRFVWHLFNAI